LQQWPKYVIEDGTMAKIEIYTKFNCPYCYRAKSLLSDKGADYDEVEISMGGEPRAEMIRRTGGQMTVPQIFIDGAHIGGSDDLAALDRAGKLDPLLGL
jgi:glutaredoxin 3